MQAEVDVGIDLLLQSRLFYLIFDILENYIECRRTSGLDSFKRRLDSIFIFFVFYANLYHE